MKHAEFYAKLEQGLVEVPVTEFDIRDGMPGVECHCPVVYAIQRRFAFLTRATIKAALADKIYVSISGISAPLAFGAPMAVGDFVHQFDNDEEVAPFSFTLEIEDGIRGGRLNRRAAERARTLLKSRILQPA